MTLLSFAAAILAFALFAVSTDAHALARLGARPSGAARRQRRIAAWVLLVLAFALATGGYGWVYGPIVWTGAIMAAAGAVFLLLNLLPRRTVR